MWPRQILLKITTFPLRLRNVLNTSRRSVNKNSLTWWYAWKTSWIHLCKTFRKHFENVLKTSWRCMTKTNILVFTKTSWRCLEDVFWRRRQKAPLRHFQDVFINANVCWITSSCTRHFLSHLLLIYKVQTKPLKIFRWVSFKIESGFPLIVNSPFQVLKNTFQLSV